MTQVFTSQDTRPIQLRSGTQIAGVTVSVKESEAHSYTAEVTKLALESGSLISDHVIIEPEVVSITFSLTNAGQGRQAAKDAFNAFVSLFKERRLIELITEHAIYTDMVCTSITPMHSAPYKGSITCSATFQKIYFVSVASAGSISSRKPSQLKTPSGKSAEGQVQSGKVESPDTNKSGAAKIADKWKTRLGTKD